MTKTVLIASAALALLVAGCGGGGSAAAPSAAAVTSAPITAVPPVVAPAPPKATFLDVPPNVEGWSAAAVVLEPSQPWEFSPVALKGSVYEPAVLFDPSAGVYTMWYGGGWERGAIGVATSTDGVHWIKRSDNPLIGQGKFTSTMVARVNVVRDGGEVYVYFATTINGVSAIFVTHSADGITNLSAPAPFIPAGPDTKNPNNSWLVQRGDGKWLAFYDSIQDPSVDVWETFSAVCDTPLGPCTKIPGALKSLQVGQGAYGSGWARNVNGKIDTYYLAAPTGNLPTYLFHACDASAAPVALGNAGNPLQPLPAGFDQNADPFLIDGADLPDGNTRMWFDQDDNARGYAHIVMISRLGALSTLSCPL